jgi:hypothetical protein
MQAPCGCTLAFAIPQVASCGAAVGHQAQQGASWRGWQGGARGDARAHQGKWALFDRLLGGGAIGLVRLRSLCMLGWRVST